MGKNPSKMGQNWIRGGVESGWSESSSSFPRGKNFTFENTKIFELLDIFTFEMRKISLFGFLGGSKVFESRKLGEKPILEVKIVKSEV